MTKIKFRELIGLAIGSPEPGHVDFEALHYLLTCFAERLNIINDDVNYKKQPETIKKWPRSKVSTELFLKKNKVFSVDRMAGGQDEAAEGANDEHPAEALAENAETAENAEKPSEVEKAAEPVIEEPPEQKPQIVVDTLDEEPDEPIQKMESDGGGSFQYQDTSQLAVMPKSSLETIPTKFMLGVSVMKDQIELSMELVALISELLLKNKRDSKILIPLVNHMQRKLRHLQRQNIYIESIFHLDENSVSWHSSDDMDEGLAEHEEMRSVSSVSMKTPVPVEPPAPLEQRIPDICRDELGLEPILVYTPEQLLDQFLELKSEFCQLLNKVNTIAAAILEQDYHGLMSMAANLQSDLETIKKQVKDILVKQNANNAKLTTALRNLDILFGEVEELKETRPTRIEVEEWLLLKVNYEDLETRVSKDELAAFQTEIERKFCEHRNMINTNERNVMNVIDHLRTTLGIDVLEELLFKLRDKFEEDIKNLQETFQHYIDLTNDECAAATARVKVFKDLSCLSCDTACVMRKIERGKVSKMPNIHNTTQMIGPLVTYELSSIRKSGIMGYYRKGELPKDPKEWLQRQKDSVGLDKCVPRQSGGIHTITSRKEFVNKTKSKRICE